MRFNQRCLNGLFLLLLLLAPASGHAGWLLGDDTTNGRTGLNLEQGYDRNTVVTVTGRVAALPTDDAGPLSLELVVGPDRLIVVLGPRWYFQDDALDWKLGDVVTARGSRAQGKDGRNYLMAQWVSLPDGGQLDVRSATGRPSWAGGQRSGAGQQQQRNGSGGRKGR